MAKSLFESNIPVMLDTEVKEIRGQDRVEEVMLLHHPSGESSRLAVDGVFIRTGPKGGCGVEPGRVHQSGRAA